MFGCWTVGVVGFGRVFCVVGGFFLLFFWLFLFSIGSRDSDRSFGSLVVMILFCVISLFWDCNPQQGP